MAQVPPFARSTTENPTAARALAVLVDMFAYYQPAPDHRVQQANYAQLA